MRTELDAQRVEKMEMSQNPKTDTEEIRGKLGRNSGRGEGKCPRRVIAKSRL